MGNDINFFFTHPFFSIISGVSIIWTIVSLTATSLAVARGILPVWIRLGKGLSNRKIAIFADEKSNELTNILVDSKLFKKKNIKPITKNEIKRAEDCSLMLVHWKSFKSEINDILNIKKDTDALIIYAPQDEGPIKDMDLMKRINSERNTILANFRGRLLNDITTSMITTAYKN